MFAHQRTLDEAHLVGYAGDLGLDTATFSEAMRDPATPCVCERRWRADCAAA